MDCTLDFRVSFGSKEARTSSKMPPVRRRFERPVFIKPQTNSQVLAIILMSKENEVDEPSASAEQHMTTISRHSFGDPKESRDSFSIEIIESMKEDYGMFVWPCSIVLAEYVWQQRSRFSGTSVVELGAGTSLPGLVAARVGSDVTLTDDSNRLEVLDNMRRVCDLNKLKCKVLGLTWGVWDAPTFSLHPKIILGADVLYETSGSVFITTYHNRSGHQLIEFLMVKWGLKCVKLLDGFSFMPSCKASGLTGNLQLAEIVLNSEQAEGPSSSWAK